jgi:hypothetical protein
MIKHIVMWNVSGDDAATRARNLALLKAEFESLRGRVPGLLHLEIGVDESRIGYACDVVLYTEFESRAALAGYADHPEHLRVRRALGEMRTARFQVDYEVAFDRTDPPPPRGAVAGPEGPAAPRTHHPEGDIHHVQAVR